MLWEEMGLLEIPSKLQLERWKLIVEPSTWTCRIHAEIFDAEFVPCPKCLEEIENNQKIQGTKKRK